MAGEDENDHSEGRGGAADSFLFLSRASIKNERPLVNEEEGRRGVLQQVAVRMQEQLGVQLQADVLIFEENADKGKWGVVARLLPKQDEMLGFVFTPENFDVEGSQELSQGETHSSAHEIGHLLLNYSEEQRPENTTIRAILDEGILEAAAITELDSNDDEQIDMREVAVHCSRVLREYHGLLEKIVDDPTLVLPLSGPLGYDGYQMNRSMVHIAGISTVFSVLGRENSHAWPVLYENPPTLEEIKNPQKYRNRIKDQLHAFPKPDVKPRLPKINPTDPSYQRLI